MLITSFLIGIIFIPNVNSNDTNKDNLRYDFEKNTLFDDFDSLNRNNVNLRHNNIKNIYLFFKIIIYTKSI